MKIAELWETVKDNQNVLVNRKEKWVAVVDEVEDELDRNSRLFKIKDNGELEEVNFMEMKQKIIDTIMRKIDHKKLVNLLLNERIITAYPQEFFDVLDRISKPKASIKAKDGCVEISIGGVVGKPFPLRIL
jgi:hypothetical protein